LRWQTLRVAGPLSKSPPALARRVCEALLVDLDINGGRAGRSVALSTTHAQDAR
jgi:hypothetical protein